MAGIRSEEGFSFIEMMMVIALASIIVAAIFLALRTGEDQAETAELKMTIQESARESLYKMVQEIRQSAPDRVTIGVGGNSLRFDFPDPAAPVDSNYNIDWANAHPIEYNIGGNGQQLMRNDTSAGQLTVLANDAVGINFTGNTADPTVVTITISVQRTLLNGRVVPAQPLQVVAQAEVRNPSGG